MAIVQADLSIFCPVPGAVPGPSALASGEGLAVCYASAQVGFHMNSNTQLPRVKTPCIGVCSTGIGDAVCRGCKRFAHEVIHWNGYSQEQKRIVDGRLAQFLAQCVRNRIRITDRQLLAWQLEVQKVRHDPDHDPHCWVFALLKAGAGQIDDPAAFGFEVLAQCAGKSLIELREDIDAEYYALSCAHHERYHMTPDLFSREHAG